MKDLTSSQRSKLIEQYVELVVDNMDRKILEEFVTEQLQYDFRNDYTDDELKEEINNFDEELYDELVDNVTDEDSDLEVIDSQELEGDISTVKDSDYAEKVDTLVDKMEMNCYTWDPNFYNEIVKDWNYRFPKFSYIEYPEFKRGI